MCLLLTMMFIIALKDSQVRLAPSHGTCINFSGRPTLDRV